MEIDIFGSFWALPGTPRTTTPVSVSTSITCVSWCKPSFVSNHFVLNIVLQIELRQACHFSCRMERLSIQNDTSEIHGRSAAGRRIAACKGLGSDPPGLSLKEEPTTVDEVGPFLLVKHWRSSLNIWFEDERAVQHGNG